MTPAGDTNSRRFRRGAAAERVTDPAEGIPLGLAVLMGMISSVTASREWPRMSWASRAGTFRFLSSVAVVCRTWCTLMVRSPWVPMMR